MFMDKIFTLRISEDGLGIYNATRLSTIYVVAKDSDTAVRHVLTDRTISIEIIDSHPCLIVK